MTKEILEQILQLSKEKQIPEKQACVQILGKYVQLSYYKKKFGIELNQTGKAAFTARRTREYVVNDSFFSSVTEISSYYAGFISADGNINKDHPNLTISLAERDKQFLEKFMKTLESNYPVRSYKSKEFPVSSLIITSKQICEDLKIHFNITPDKSLSYTPPTLEQPYLDCFIMGLIDGDGTIGFSTRKSCKDSLYISFVGTKESCALIKKRFEEILGKETSKLFQRDKDKNYYSYRISDRNARIVFMYFYERYNSLPTLHRKWSREHYDYCKSWKKSSVPNRQKGVNVFNLKGELIKICKTLKEAEEFTGTASSTISKLCKESTNMHQSNGYMFGRDIEFMKPYKEQELLDKGESNIEDES